jgi:hypothetical protein
MLGRLEAGEPGAAILGLVAGDLHLAGEHEHVGIEPHAEQRCRIDLPGFGKGRRLVEDPRQRGQAELEGWN